jgi:excisionase family DNA binding protein
MSDSIKIDWKPEPALWTKKQAAAYLNVSVRTIGNLLRRRELARRKIGTKTLIPRTSVDAFVKRDHATESEEQKQERQHRKAEA